MPKTHTKQRDSRVKKIRFVSDDFRYAESHHDIDCLGPRQQKNKQKTDTHERSDSIIQEY